VDGAEIADDALNHVLAVCSAGDVTGFKDGAAAKLGDFCGYSLPSRFVYVGEGNRSTLAGEQESGGAPDAGRSACDHSDLSVELMLRHECLGVLNGLVVLCGRGRLARGF